jgi:hypothetical protein
MSSNWLGIMFHVTGTAATQYSRVCADAAGAAANAATPPIVTSDSASRRLTSR